jgi:hypothetical protein
MGLIMANREYEPSIADLARLSVAAKLSVADQAYLRAGAPDMSRHPDPVPERMDSGDHFSPVQFSDQLGAVAHSRDEVPAVHRDPLAWYGTQRVIRHPDLTGLEAQDV